MNAPSIKPFSERGFIAQINGFSSDIDGGLYANAVAAALRSQEAIDDAVAGIDSVAIRFDPAHLGAEDAKRMLLSAIENTPHTARPEPGKHIELPVCYGGEYGPDFDDLCTQFDLTPDALVQLHSGATYRVITLGFAPGFVYLGELPGGLDVPRLETPRPRVEAGSVGLAGRYTGVYSLPSPGGWRIIGRTPLALFNPENESPFFFEAGDEVRFKAVTPEEFGVINRKNR